MSDTSNTDAPAGEPHGDAGNEGAEQTPTIEDVLAQLEAAKKESRKWEDRSKANKSAADELAELRRSSMTDAEKATADRADLETRITDAEDRATKAEAALARLTVAIEFGLDKEDTEALEGVADEAALRTLAARLSGRSETRPPRPNPSQGRRGDRPAATPAQAFADALDGLFD